LTCKHSLTFASTHKVLVLAVVETAEQMTLNCQMPK